MLMFEYLRGLQGMMMTSLTIASMAVNRSYKEEKVLKRTGKREETEQSAGSAKF